jgi:hypothetical protein
VRLFFIIHYLDITMCVYHTHRGPGTGAPCSRIQIARSSILTVIQEQ